jgi:transcription initiation factor TFIID TATA-box-binding protein
MTDPRETLEIQNVVASTEIGQEIHLEELAGDLSHSEYNPEHFPGIVFRSPSPKATTLIFRSGKTVCTGAKTVENVHRAVTIVFDELRELGVEVEEDPEIAIQNMVSSGDLGQQLNLNAIAIGLGLKDTEYEPEQFPGLVYQLSALDVVVLLFGSGKMVVTGATSVGDTEAALETVQSRLQELDLMTV